MGVSDTYHKQVPPPMVKQNLPHLASSSIPCEYIQPLLNKRWLSASSSSFAEMIAHLTYKLMKTGAVVIWGPPGPWPPLGPLGTCCPSSGSAQFLVHCCHHHFWVNHHPCLHYDHGRSNCTCNTSPSANNSLFIIITFFLGTYGPSIWWRYPISPYPMIAIF